MISVFEYVTILISIILGLGITKLLGGFATMAVRINQCTIYWPHVIFIVLAFLIHIQDWFVTYELRKISTWNLPLFLFVVLYPVTLYLLSYMLFPVKYGNSTFNYKDFFLGNYVRIYSLLIILALLSVLQNVFLFHYTWMNQLIQLFIVVSLLLVLLFKLNKSIVHQSIAVVLMLFFIASLLVEWNTLIIE
ncbi:MAG: hypothetical protein ACK5WV_04445 [Chryseotalea sp.]